MVRRALDTLKKFWTLTKHFNLRYINNDTLIFDKQKRVNLIALFSLLAVSMGFLSHLLLRLYLFGLQPDPCQIWLEKTYFMTILMSLVGIIFTIMWDNLSPDHRDYLNLVVLPIRPTTLFLSKLLSIVIFVGLTTLVFNLFSTLIFSFYLTRRLNIHPLGFGFFHYLTHFLAYLFIFFIIASIQGIIRGLFKNKWYRNISTILQTTFLTLFISTLIWFPSIFPLLPSLKEESSSFVYLFPPLWFVGLGEILMGRNDSTFSVYIYIIIIAFTIPVGLYLLSIPGFFRKHLKTRQSPRKTLKPSKIKTALKKSFDSMILGNPLERGSFYFSLKTLNRSKKHKMHLLTFLVAPSILVFITLTILYLKFEAPYFKTINIYLIAVPLILIFFMVWGIRITITHVVNPAANWIFTLKPPKDSRHFLSGAKKAFTFSIILPLLMILLFIYFYLWGLLAAASHLFYCLACSLLLINLLFINYPYIPFISPPERKRRNHKVSGLTFLIGFFSFTYLFSVLGIYLIRNPEFYILFYLSVIMIFFLMKWIYYYYHGELIFTYNKVLDRVMVNLEFDP